MKLPTKDLITRAAWTFAQSFLVVFLGGLLDVFNAFSAGLDVGKAALVALALASVAAGLSALKTLVLQYR